MSLKDIFDRRENQLRRVLDALPNRDRAETLAIVLSWMSINDVERMLETLEKPQ